MSRPYAPHVTPAGRVTLQLSQRRQLEGRQGTPHGEDDVLVVLRLENPGHWEVLNYDLLE